MHQKERISVKIRQLKLVPRNGVSITTGKKIKWTSKFSILIYLYQVSQGHGISNSETYWTDYIWWVLYPSFYRNQLWSSDVGQMYYKYKKNICHSGLIINGVVQSRRRDIFFSSYLYVISTLYYSADFIGWIFSLIRLSVFGFSYTWCVISPNINHSQQLYCPLL